MGTCQGTPQCATQAAALMPLTTTKLREIAMAQGIGAGTTGIQFNRAVGLAFESWVLGTMGQIPRYTKPLLMSPLRQTFVPRPVSLGRPADTGISRRPLPGRWGVARTDPPRVGADHPQMAADRDVRVGVCDHQLHRRHRWVEQP